MNAKHFEELCRELLDKSEETLFRKSKEYASDEDRLANFRQPTAMMKMSTAEVCLMYQMKHISSIAKIAKETSNGILPTKELLQEKCQDMLNYTLIFYTTVCEMLEQEQKDLDRVTLPSVGSWDLNVSVDPYMSPSILPTHEQSNNQSGCVDTNSQDA